MLILLYRYCSGVDLNCGCPQRWAKTQGIGCIMLESPELISDLVRQCRNHISKVFSVSVKMRILSDIKYVYISSKIKIFQAKCMCLSF